MASQQNSNSVTTFSLIHKLVCHLKKNPETIHSNYRFALYMLSRMCVPSDYDDFGISEQIKIKLIAENRQKDVVTFTDLHRRLQTSTVLKNKSSVLQFLCSLYNAEEKEVAAKTATNGRKPDSLNPEMILNANDIISKQVTTRPKFLYGDCSRKGATATSANSQSSKSNYKASDNDMISPYSSTIESDQLSVFSSSSERRNFAMGSLEKPEYPEKSLAVTSGESNLGTISLSITKLRPLLRDILFALQGLKGEIIIWDPDRSNFNITFDGSFPNPVKRLTLRFIEMGWLYCHINHYCKMQSNEKSLGLVGQSFIASLKEKLTEYYKLIAQMEAFLNQETTLTHLYNNSNSLTLHRLSVWLYEPLTRFKILASVVDACKGKKGGALASVLYAFLQHGDSFLCELVRNLLRVVTRPLFKMLSYWIYCGELEDVYGEFFVATNVSIPDNCLWQEKYSLNKAMIPSFISTEQARKILSTGKAINFLRQVCQDNTFARDEDRRMRALELMSTESIFSQGRDAKFEMMLETNYVNTSKSVLKVLNSEFYLMDHLLAMRNYFLLGQGDFIRHLMDLLDEDLAKPANMLYIHNLSGILESAIRATNAQFHNPEVLQRLDVRLLEVSLGDTGWDVFSLDYHADGPICTVFTPQCMTSYLRLFSALWRAKRMEYVLSKISQSRTSYLKLQEKLPCVTPVLYLCHLLLAQMIHFVQQMQYYTAFEVMECCWADLQLKISSAQDLDEVIAAHENFLDTLLTRALLDEESLALRTQLKAIYDLIIQFHKLQETFWNQVKDAAEKLEEKQNDIQRNTAKGNWGITEAHKKEYDFCSAQLIKIGIPHTKAQLQVLSNSYEDMVQKFLITLNFHDDPNLRFLSFRLDFNEHFKCRNSRLRTSLTYQHRRKSTK